MCGKWCRKCLLLLVLLLCSPLVYSQSSLGDADVDPGWIYEVSGGQLLMWQNTMKTQSQQLTLLATELQMSRNDLTAVQNELQTSKRAMTLSEEASMILSQAALSAEERAGRYRSLSIVLGTTTAGGLLFILFTIFGR